MFHFTCFNVEDPDDPSVGLFNGELAIPGNLLRREVFDPVINEVRKFAHPSIRHPRRVPAPEQWSSFQPRIQQPPSLSDSPPLLSLLSEGNR